jgi:hypothetical protein
MRRAVTTMPRQASRPTAPGRTAPNAWTRFQVHEAVPSGEKPKLGPIKGAIPAHADNKSARKPPRIKLSGALPGEVATTGTLSGTTGGGTPSPAVGAKWSGPGSLIGVSIDTSSIASRSY